MRAKRRRFAPLAAPAHAHRARLKTGFFNEIDGKRTLPAMAFEVAIGREAVLLHLGRPSPTPAIQPTAGKGTEHGAHFLRRLLPLRQ